MLALRAAPWQEPAMAERPAPAAGGCLIALGIVIGIVVGYLGHEPSLGVVIGAGIGAALAVLVWLVDRRKDMRRRLP